MAQEALPEPVEKILAAGSQVEWAAMVELELVEIPKRRRFISNVLVLFIACKTTTFS
jgi:hypothetical protein